MFRQQRTKNTSVLEESPLFQGLPEGDLRLIERHADMVDVSAGMTVANPRRIPREFVAIREGTLSARSQGEAVTLHAGDDFGGLELLAHAPCVRTVTAETPASLLVIEARSFAYLMTAVPALERRIKGRIIQTLQDPAA